MKWNEMKWAPVPSWYLREEDPYVGFFRCALSSRAPIIQKIFFLSQFCGHYLRAAPIRERPLLARVRYVIYRFWFIIGTYFYWSGASLIRTSCRFMYHHRASCIKHLTLWGLVAKSSILKSQNVHKFFGNNDDGRTIYVQHFFLFW